MKWISIFCAVTVWFVHNISVTATSTSGDIFLNAASIYVNDKPGLIQLYLDSERAHQNNHISTLDVILEDMVNYVRENEDENAPRNILTVLADDQGYADIGYNDPTFRTPTLDKLASNGVTFDSFYAQSTCSPTRASLLTGLNVIKTGLQDGALIPGESRYLPYHIKTSGNYFQEAGYSTYFIGKWHIGQRYMNQTPNARGYDYFFGFLGGAIDSFHKDLGLLCGDKQNNFTEVFADNCKYLNAYDFQENGVPYNDTMHYANNIMTDKAVAQVLLHDPSLPFLMHYHTNVPHTPLRAETELYELCKGVSVAPQAYQPIYRQVLCAMVSSLDIDLLRLLMALGLQGMLPHTLIQYNSDNGGLTQAGSVNLPYRGEKGGTFEGGIRVPAFMYGNGLHLSHTIKPIRNDLIAVPDILPTLLGYAGVDFSPFTFDGYNMWNTLRLGLPLPRTDIPLVCASKALGFFSAFIQIYHGQRFKYLFDPSVLTFVAISSFGQTYQKEGEFLFNLSEDPYETTNLSDDSRYFVLINYLRLRTIAMGLISSQTTQVTVVPPPIDTPPSPLGCWLPIDSPLYYTAHCPAGEPYFNYTLGLFEVGEVFDPSIMFKDIENMEERLGSDHIVGSKDKYTEYVTSNMCL